MSEDQLSSEQSQDQVSTDTSQAASDDRSTENVSYGATEHVTEASGPGFTESLSSPGFAETVHESSEKSFTKSFSDCMGNLGLPAPTSLFSTAAAAIATIKAIQAAIATYGTEVTIAELIGAGLLSDALAVAGALTASFYVGACIGCLIAAGIDWALY